MHVVDECTIHLISYIETKTLNVRRMSDLKYGVLLFTYPRILEIQNLMSIIRLFLKIIQVSCFLSVMSCISTRHLKILLNFLRQKIQKTNPIVYIICKESKNVKIIKKKIGSGRNSHHKYVRLYYWAFLPLHDQLIKAYF